MSGLITQNLSVQLGGAPILNDVSLSVPTGAVTAVLGPSGSGKSTLLRAVAGLVPSSGTVRLDDADISKLPTHRRGIGLMFQSHALFPHLSVADNIAFGLTEQGVAKAAADARVEELLELVDLTGFGRRSVQALSGGEAQRVALARALAPGPKLLMLDEPLGALDRRLREELTDQLAALLRQTGTTALYVTHDQEEAAVVADRLVILEQGSVIAEGSAMQLWQDPASPWLARFLGHPNVSDQALVPVRSVHIGGTIAHDHQKSATVLSCRFVDGVWRVVVELAEPFAQLRRLEAVSSSPFDVRETVAVVIDQGTVRSFSA